MNTTSEQYPYFVYMHGAATHVWNGRRNDATPCGRRVNTYVDEISKKQVFEPICKVCKGRLNDAPTT